MLKSEVLHKHVNVSGIVPQCDLLFNVLMLFGDPWPMIFALIGYTLVIFPSNSFSFFVGPVSTKSSPCVKPDTRFFCAETDSSS